MGMTAPVTAETDNEARRLRMTAAVFVMAVLFHNSDHLRRGGDSVPASVFWVGSAAILVEVAIVALAFAPHRITPFAAVVAGFGLALGYMTVHFTPQRSFFSDSFVSGGASPLSIIAASAETAAALYLAFVGLELGRRRGWTVPTWPGDAASVLRAFRHPLVAVMAVGNLIIFIGSLATR